MYVNHQINWQLAITFIDNLLSKMTIKEKIGLDLGRISYLLADMEKTNMVQFTGMNDNIPVFTALV